MANIENMNKTTNITCKKKYTEGIKNILFVLARKSAEASSTSIAVLSWSYPQKSMHAKIEANRANVIAPII